MQYVNWHEAVAFTIALSEAEGLAPCFTCTGTAPEFDCELDAAYATPYDCDGYRLPTEAEYEYAIRAGEQAAFPNGGNLLSGDEKSCDGPVVLDNGTELGDFSWYCGNSDSTIHSVGILEPNNWGLYDVLGNVAEWACDEYAYYTSDSVVDPFASDMLWTSSRKIFRGGRYDETPDYVRSAERMTSSPTSRYIDIGLRVARTHR